MHNLRNRHFLKEIDFTTKEMEYFLTCLLRSSRPSTQAPRRDGWRARRSH